MFCGAFISGGVIGVNPVSNPADDVAGSIADGTEESGSLSLSLSLPLSWSLSVSLEIPRNPALVYVIFTQRGRARIARDVVVLCPGGRQEILFNLGAIR